MTQRHIEFARVHNFRDLGGYGGVDGTTVRWGQLYRSDALSKLDDSDWTRFQALGIRTVIDLRYPFEIAAAGRVRADASLTYHNLSIEHRPYDQTVLGADVEPERFLADRHLEVAHDGVVELRQALELVAAEDRAPLVFHCASGKDRTGLLAAIILALLGVGEDDIVADFTLTERATGRLVADWHRNHPDAPPLWPGYGRTPAGIMRLFLADIADQHGSLTGYAYDRLGVDHDFVATLRQRLLQR